MRRYQMLTSVATMLLHARTDVESQRLWSGIVLRLLEFIAKKTDVMLHPVQMMDLSH